MKPAIETNRITKRYGHAIGVLDLDLEVHEGEIFGYLGPNGAGKTTTIRLLLDLIRPSSGSARVLGKDANQESLFIRDRVGYLPGELNLYERLTPRQTTRYLLALRGRSDERRALELAELLEVELDRPIGDLSKGNKQKVGLLQAFMHDPELLILDEPTSGLDPFVQKTVHSLLAAARSEGRTVFLSSHVLHEVEEIADRIGVIRKGRLIAVEKIADLKAKAIRSVEVHFGEPVAAADLEGIPNVHSLELKGDVAHIKIVGRIDPLVKAIARFDVADLIAHETDLEEIFFTFYTKESE